MIVWMCEGWSDEEGRAAAGGGDSAVGTGEVCEVREASVKASYQYWIRQMG